MPTETPGVPARLPAICRSIGILATALWLGSLVHMLLSVATLFRAFPKATSSVAVEAAPVLFQVTERANLIVAYVALLSTCWWRHRCRSRQLTWSIHFLSYATVVAWLQAYSVSPRMEALRKAGEAGGSAFASAHATSSVQYVLQTMLVAAALLLLVNATRTPGGASSVSK